MDRGVWGVCYVFFFFQNVFGLRWLLYGFFCSVNVYMEWY